MILRKKLYHALNYFIFINTFYRDSGESSSVLINNNVACLYHYAKKPTLAFTSVYKAIVQHQKNILDVTKPIQCKDH